MLGMLHLENGGVILISDKEVIHMNFELKQVVIKAVCIHYTFTFLYASGEFCCLLIALETSLDPDPERQKDLDPNRLTMIFKQLSLKNVRY